jgi:hypothetical protein
MFADLDPGERRTQVWCAIRAFYHSEQPTGDESERTRAHAPSTIPVARHGA